MLLLGFMLSGCVADAPRSVPADTLTSLDDSAVSGHDSGVEQIGGGPDPTDAWFGDDAVRIIAIELDDAAIDALHAAPDAYVSGDLTVDGTEYGPVGVRLKGNGSFEPINKKPSFRLKLDRDQEGLLIDGERRILLHNFHWDAGRVSEYLAYGFFREVGLPAPRVGYAEVTVSGEPYGFYSVIEDMDERFLARWWDDNDGNLYEGSGDWTNALYWELAEPGEPADGSDAWELALAADSDDPLAALEPLLDTEQVLRFIAAERVIAHHDSFTGNLNNYRMYRDPQTGLWSALPWSTDAAWGWIWHQPYHSVDGRVYYPCGDYWPDPADYHTSLYAAACEADSDCMAALLEQVIDLQGALNDFDLPARADALRSFVAPWVEADSRSGIPAEDFAPASDCFYDWAADRVGAIQHYLDRLESGCDVRTDQDIYAEGAPITISFDHAQGDSDDWVGIFRDDKLIDWVWTSGSRERMHHRTFTAELTFEGLDAGLYEAQLHFDGTDRKTVCGRAAFAVQ